MLARARQVSLRQGHTIFEARLEYPDVERDLCQLDVPGMTAAVAPLGSARGLRIGQRYAPELRGVNWDEVLDEVQNGANGKLVEVEDQEDNERVEIFVD